MIKLDNIILPIRHNIDIIKEICAKKLKILSKNIKNVEYIKLSLDARRKNNIKYIASLALTLNEKEEEKFKDLKFNLDRNGLEYQTKELEKSPIIVGFGPSGMFAGLALAKMGLKPIIIEQGKSVDERKIDVVNFWQQGKLNKFSNVQFGEGGAGTFSDGKLNSNTSNEITKKVINELYLHGAPKEILYLSKPHIGSDNLQNVVKNIREEIINLGGKILFSHKMTDISIKNNQICGVFIEKVENEKESCNDSRKNTDDNIALYIETNHLLLCLGHSARDSFEMLYKNGLNIKQKPFAMGVRIESKQEEINIGQYGKNYDKALPNADYKLVTHLQNGRSVFTFCMCPGGQVVASSSNEGEIVTNGMSYFARNGENANSALLVNVYPDDFGSTHPLAGIKMQEKYEKLAFELGGKDYSAPAQTVKEFLHLREGKEYLKSTIAPSYTPKVKFTDISKCLPNFVTESLKEALPLLNKKLSGFANADNILIAIESRSSCPLTIVRDETFQSSIKGIYPVGEGAGYAGGIITSAQDGIKVAEAIYKTL